MYRSQCDRVEGRFEESIEDPILWREEERKRLGGRRQGKCCGLIIEKTSDSEQELPSSHPAPSQSTSAPR